MKKHNKIQDDSIEENRFKTVYQALRIFRKLSDEEAKVFIEMLKWRKVTIENMKDILKSKNLKITTSKPYTILRNLEEQNLVFEEKSGGKGKKIFSTINPRDLMMDMGEEIKNLDTEITLLESEEPKFIEEEVIEEPKLLETDYEITEAISNLISKEYGIEFYYNDISLKQTDMLFKRLTKRFALKPIKGVFSAVFATKKKEPLFPYIAIIFSLRNKMNENKSSSIGCKIVDPEIIKCLRGGVKNE